MLTLETRALAVQAAIAGMGAAVVDRNLVADMLAAGMLVEIAPDPPVPAAEGHWFVALPDRLRIRQVRLVPRLADHPGRTPRQPGPALHSRASPGLKSLAGANRAPAKGWRHAAWIVRYGTPEPALVPRFWVSRPFVRSAVE